MDLLIKNVAMECVCAVVGIKIKSDECDLFFQLNHIGRHTSAATDSREGCRCVDRWNEGRKGWCNNLKSSP